MGLSLPTQSIHTAVAACCRTYVAQSTRREEIVDNEQQHVNSSLTALVCVTAHTAMLHYLLLRNGKIRNASSGRNQHASELGERRIHHHIACGPRSTRLMPTPRNLDHQWGVPHDAAC